jgi:hypothetical protein
MSDLCILEISRCWGLRSLPDSFGQLTDLTSLGLGCCYKPAGVDWGADGGHPPGSEPVPGTAEPAGVGGGADEADELGPEPVPGAATPARVGLRADGLMSLNLSGCKALWSLPKLV